MGWFSNNDDDNNKDDTNKKFQNVFGNFIEK